MKKLAGPPFDQWRDASPRTIALYHSAGDETCGVFNVVVPSTDVRLLVIASSGAGWDHVSVSRPSRCPTWEEMVFVKRVFFGEDEWAIEYHPPPDKNISRHPFCLHLWRPHDVEIPVPPEFTIG